MRRRPCWASAVVRQRRALLPSCRTLASAAQHGAVRRSGDGGACIACFCAKCVGGWRLLSQSLARNRLVGSLPLSATYQRPFHRFILGDYGQRGRGITGRESAVSWEQSRKLRQAACPLQAQTHCSSFHIASSIPTPFQPWDWSSKLVAATACRVRDQRRSSYSVSFGSKRHISTNL